MNNIIIRLFTALLFLGLAQAAHAQARDIIWATRDVIIENKRNNTDRKISEDRVREVAISTNGQIRSDEIRAQVELERSRNDAAVRAAEISANTGWEGTSSAQNGHISVQKTRNDQPQSNTGTRQELSSRAKGFASAAQRNSGGDGGWNPQP